MTKPKFNLVLLPNERTLVVESGAPLSDALFAYGVEFPCGGASLCGRCRVRVLSGDLPITDEARAVFTDQELAAGWRLSCQAAMQGPLTLEIAQWEASILSDEAAVPFEPAAGLGVAIDLGTTTLVAQAVDLATGEVLGVASGLNPQAVHGADVMSRIQFAISGDAGAQRLAQLIREALGDLIRKALQSCGRSGGDVRTVIVAGNTVMHHLFCGESVEPLSHVPFETADDGLRRFTPADLGWPLAASATVDFLPCLGGFVGSDLLTGIVACGLLNATEPTALIDLGTNGEIVLKTKDGILCASTAAGPAFEGGGIGMGMRAGTGAIVHVNVRDGRLDCHVLGGDGTEAAGICGSGLVDAVAGALLIGSLAQDGRLANGARELPLTGTVRLTRGDIRELQLAKAAIASGLRLLASHAGLTLDDIGALHLAGAFGNYIDVPAAHRIGLLETPPARIRPAGNTALRGARMLLLSPSRRDAIVAQILKISSHVALVSEPGFQDTFVDCLALTPAGVN
jgi:uncharacterized 2Fe-2S/4Fe-4S cluster protein (DUF4445 family)